MGAYHFVGTGASNRRFGNTRNQSARNGSVTKGQDGTLPRNITADGAKASETSTPSGKTTGGDSASNNIGKFLKGAKSRGPYGGPSFRSLSNVYKDYQAKDTSSISEVQTPSDGGAERYTGNAKAKVVDPPMEDDMTSNNPSTPAIRERSVKKTNDNRGRY